ncbi:MAG: hypothetical protein RLP02_12230, partial [Coleofasciculus sp. C2-GNP5-27]
AYLQKLTQGCFPFVRLLSAWFFTNKVLLDISFDSLARKYLSQVIIRELKSRINFLSFPKWDAPSFN